MTAYVIYCMILYKKIEMAQCILFSIIYVIYLSSITEAYIKTLQNANFDIFSQKIINILTIICIKMSFAIDFLKLIC